MSRKTKIFTTIGLVFVALDQISKLWIRQNLCLQPSRFCELPRSFDVIDGLLQIVHVENRGAAFGMLNSFEYRMWLFLVFTIFAVAMLIQCLRQLEPEDRFLSTTLGLIMAGAIGNGIDRVDKQAVTDFIRFYVDSPELKTWLISTFGTNEYPSFNVADMCIVIGVGLFVVHYLFLEDREEDMEVLADSLDEQNDSVSAQGES